MSKPSRPCCAWSCESGKHHVMIWAMQLAMRCDAFILPRLRARVGSKIDQIHFAIESATKRLFHQKHNCKYFVLAFDKLRWDAAARFAKYKMANVSLKRRGWREAQKLQFKLRRKRRGWHESQDICNCGDSTSQTSIRTQWGKTQGGDILLRHEPFADTPTWDLTRP